jgi:predicted nuclease of predicted toxin-antitoxin system
MIRVLVDMNLSPRWAMALKSAGFEALHWSVVGSPRALDAEVLGHAAANGWVLFTHDLDFGAILAHSRAGKPSVIQLREENVDPDLHSGRVSDVIRRLEPELNGGVIVTIEPGRERIRILPLKPP